MAIGIQGMRAGAPFFITGDPRKEYQFKFVLVPPITPILSTPNLNKIGSWLSIFSFFQLIYISSLAEQVDLPVSKLDVGSVNIGILQQYPYLKGLTFPTFSVVYLEDELESIYKFHKMWQDNISDGFLLEPLGTVCCSAIYMPVKPISLAITSDIYTGVEVPLGAEVFPFIFPSEIRRSPANKSGQGVGKTTVVYTRVPNITGLSLSYQDKTSVSSSPRNYEESLRKGS